MGKGSLMTGTDMVLILFLLTITPALLK